MEPMRLSAPEVTREGSSTLLESEVTMQGRGGQRLWIRTTGEAVPATNDAFVAFALLPAMKLGVPLVSEGPVSRSLLEEALPGVQRVHAIWGEDTRHPRRGRFTPIDVRAPLGDDAPRGPGVGVFFSGGVDSSFSLLEAREAITDLVFIHDFEAAFPEEPRRAALAGVERVARAFGKRLVQVETNAKEVFGDIVSWHHYHGAFLIGCALPQQGRLGLVHIPSSVDVGRIVPWGSHPLLDPAWSTAATTFVHDRLDVTRFEKTAVVARDRVLLENLRVCWAPHQNCGWCS
ncbi:MAG: hypothetical protein LPK31_05145, partial [Actinomycetes bacterium]|nr:hypothetical protein [Actinomycetes bacterium]